MEKKMTKRQLQAQATKSKIYNSAISLFSQKDFNSVTIQDICSNAEISNGLFYNYFSSKADILGHTFAMFDTQYAEIVQRFQASESALRWFQLFLEYSIRITMEDPLGLLATRLFYSSEALGLSESSIYDPNRLIFQIFAKIVAHGKDCGEISHELNSERIVRFLHDYYMGINLRFLNVEDRERFFDELRLSAELMWRALG
jgi:Transcriptional regulator